MSKKSLDMYLDQLLNWLKIQSDTKGVLKLSVIVILFNIFASLYVVLILFSLGISLPDQLENIEEYNSLTIVLIIAVATFTEEVVFRLPLAAAIWKWGVSKKVLYAAFFLSIIFGLVHGSVFNILIQGVIGLSYVVLFLKFGGFGGKYIKALFLTWIVHALYDYILLIPFLLS